MNRKSYLLISAVIFALFAFGHLVRVILYAPVTFGEHAVPMVVSWIAMFAAAALSTWGFRLRSREQ